MASVTDDLQFAVRPSLVQLPGVIQRANHVIATMDDHAGQMSDFVHVANQLIGFKEGIVGEVVAFDTSDG
ncbi:hypothetical protein D9M71_821590 [compost metagenome]